MQSKSQKGAGDVETVGCIKALEDGVRASFFRYMKI